jgi:hypothetical protein
MYCKSQLNIDALRLHRLLLQWEVTQLRNSRYLIKSALCGHYAGNFHRRDYVSGEKRETGWIIARTKQDPNTYLYVSSQSSYA